MRRVSFLLIPLSFLLLGAGCQKINELTTPAPSQNTPSPSPKKEQEPEVKSEPAPSATTTQETPVNTESKTSTPENKKPAAKEEPKETSPATKTGVQVNVDTTAKTETKETPAETPAPTPAPTPSVKEFTMTAKQWSFEPSTITVNKGDTVELTIKSIDVTHGFALPEFGINKNLKPGETVNVEFVADKTGTFSFFCSVSCGAGHSDMIGKLIVQ